MKVALVYDRVNTWGGAERVLLALHKMFPAAPLFTSLYQPKKAKWAQEFTIFPSFLQHLPFLSKHHEYIPFFMPLAFESFIFDEYDLVISITSEAAKGVITRGKTKHLCYMLTPTRYLWSGYEDYFRTSVMRVVTSPVVSYLRAWDKVAASRPDKIIAISKEVAARVQEYYHRDAEVIYPPVPFTDYDGTTKSQSFFLLVSRLSLFTQYKRVDLAIEACNRAKVPLKIVGSGSWMPYLQKIAGPTIHFLGNLTDDELKEYYKSCSALLFPGKEDLGLAMVEAQAFGKPVIAYAAGGAREIVANKASGLLFYPQTITELQKKIQEFQTYTFSEAICRKQAEKFSPDTFEEKFLTVVKEMI